MIDEETYSCIVREKKYCYRIGNLRFNENGRTYSGVATAWWEETPKKVFTVPFYTKYDEIDSTCEKISQWIEEYVMKNKE